VSAQPQSWQWLEQGLFGSSQDELQSRWQEMRRGLQDSNPSGGPSRWNLDPLPAVLAESDWLLLERGLLQRAQLLNALLADAYGQQQLLREGQLHPALYYNNPLWLQACHGMVDSELARLMWYAVDLIRDPSGRWQVVRDRTQCASGLGATLENRRWMARVYHELFSDHQVQPVAPSYQALRSTLAELGQRTRGARTVMLTSQAGSAQSWDDASLAQFLGCPLVEGEDLTVRGGGLYLKLLEGLQPVDVLLRRLPDRHCDPLEIAVGGWNGVVGLLQTVRAGNVVVSNSLGSGWLESPALALQLERLAPLVLGQPLLLPSLTGHWEDQLPQGRDWVARPFQGGPPVLLPELEPERQRQWWQECRPERWVFQRYSLPSRFPCWCSGHPQSLPGVLRCFLISTGEGYQLVPGGLVRLRSRPDGAMLSKDLWRPASGSFSARPTPMVSGADLALSRSGGDVPSRVADQFYWFGRYLERCESLVRFARLLVQRQTHEADAETLQDLHRLLTCQGELGCDLVSWVNGSQNDQLQALLGHLRRLGGALRDRVSADLPRILGAMQPLSEAVEGRHLLAYLESLSVPIWALVAIARESLYRGFGFRFLEIGRRLERAMQTCDLLQQLSQGQQPGWRVLEILLEVTDSGRTYRRRYARLEWMPVLDLLLADETHPRSVAFQLRSLEEHCARLPQRVPLGLAPHQEALLRSRATVQLWRPPQGAPLGELAALLPLISQGLAAVYLTHVRPRSQGGDLAL
jgi:uncharacterized circularly permuted ATP-grasp superfamily protein/uncharacterized alpha-E superfamily protein